MDCSLPGSSVHGIFQARVLEWGAIALSSGRWLDLNKSMEARENMMRWEAMRISVGDFREGYVNMKI